MSKLNYTMCMDWKFTHSDFFFLNTKKGGKHTENENNKKRNITSPG